MASQWARVQPVRGEVSGSGGGRWGRLGRCVGSGSDTCGALMRVRFLRWSQGAPGRGRADAVAYDDVGAEQMVGPGGVLGVAQCDAHGGAAEFLSGGADGGEGRVEVLGE